MQKTWSCDSGLRIENYICAARKIKKGLFSLLAVLQLQIFSIILVWLQSATKMCYVIDELTPYIHEKADKRLFFHAKLAFKSWNLHLRQTIKTDLVVIAVYAFQRLPKPSELRIEFRIGKQENLFSSTKSAKLSDHLYVINNYFFMLLAVAISHLRLVKKLKSRFSKPGKIVQR